ncbi:hypothetical protein NHF46_24850 [Arthrobacter alpinus]|nr:hypothetical protein [Arthrobacter alpinus]
MALDLSPVKGGGQHRLRVALKMAWRDIRRHRGRSALIVALIALPIFAMSFAATAGMSTQATPAETVAMELGQTQGPACGPACAELDVRPSRGRRCWLRRHRVHQRSRSPL